MDKPYGFEFNKSHDANSPDWYCSELLWAAFYHQEIYLDTNHNSNNTIYPSEIVEYNNITPILGHNYTTEITSLDAQQHKIICNQKEYTESHRFEQIDRCHIKCKTCGYTEQNNIHTYKIYRSCGDGMYHTKMCPCGAGIKEACLGVANVDGTTNCTKCGQTIGGSGLLYMNDEELRTILPSDGLSYLIDEKIKNI